MDLQDGTWTAILRVPPVDQAVHQCLSITVTILLMLRISVTNYYSWPDRRLKVKWQIGDIHEVHELRRISFRHTFSLRATLFPPPASILYDIWLELKCGP